MLPLALSPSKASFIGDTSEGNVKEPTLTLFEKSSGEVFTHVIPTKLKRRRINSLQASSPIWTSEASLARTRERAAKPRGGEERLEARTFSRDSLRLPK